MILAKNRPHPEVLEGSTFLHHALGHGALMRLVPIGAGADFHIERVANFIPRRIDCSLGRLAQQVFELCKDLFNRIEVE